MGYFGVGIGVGVVGVVYLDDWLVVVGVGWFGYCGVGWVDGGGWF